MIAGIPDLKFDALLLAGRRISNQPARLATAILVGGALALLTLLRAPGGGQTQVAPEAYARSLQAAGDYARAADALRAAYRINPSEPLRIEFAQALLATGDYSGALELLATAQARDDDSPGALHVAVLRAEAMAQLGRYDEARAVAADIGSIYPGRGALIAARAYFAMGAYDQGEASLAEALRAGGESLAESWLLRARTALMAGEIQRARAAAARAGEASGNADSRFMRAVDAIRIEAFAREGRYADAQAALLRWAPENKGRAGAADPQAEYMAAYLDVAQGRYAAAAQRLRPLETWVRRQLHGALILAYARLGAGDIAQAERLFRQAANAAPSDWVSQDALVGFLLARGRGAEAETALRRLEAVEPGRGAVRRLALRRAKGELDAALFLLRTTRIAELKPAAAAAVFGPNSAPAREESATRPGYAPNETLLSAALWFTDEPAQAHLAAQSLASYTEDPLALTLAGDLFLIAQDETAAAARYDAALARVPDFAAAFEGRIRVDVRAGDLRAARERLEDRLAARPEDAGARLMLARALRGLDDAQSAARVLREDDRLAARPEAALVYAHLLADAAPEDLRAFAIEARRTIPNSPESVEILWLAGFDEEAASAARYALIAAPKDAQRAQAYAEAMARIGRARDGAAFLEALLRANPESEGARAAIGVLRAGGELSTGEYDMTDTEFSPGVWTDESLNAVTAFQMRTSSVLRPAPRNGTEAAQERHAREAAFWAPAADSLRPILRDTL